MIYQQQATFEYWADLVLTHREKTTYRKYTDLPVMQQQVTFGFNSILEERWHAVTKGDEYAEFVILISGIFTLLGYYQHRPMLLACPGIRYKSEPPTPDQLLFIQYSTGKEDTFREVVNAMKQQLKLLLEHRRYDFGKLLTLLKENYEEKTADLYEVGVVHHSLHHPTAYHADRFALLFMFGQRNGLHEITISYDSNSYTTDLIHRIGTQLPYLLQQVLGDAGRPLQQLLPLIPEELDELAIRFNDTRTSYPVDQSIVTLFDNTAALHGDRIAVQDSDGTMTYSVLKERVHMLGAHLPEAFDIRHGDRVGILVEPGVDMVIAILAILKAGAAYVPLDPGLPAERIRHIAEDTSIRLVITRADLLGILAGYYQGPLFAIDIQLDMLEYSGDIRWPHVQATDTAYIMYTSGSTGTPKGIAIRHQGVVRLVRDTNYVTIRPEDHILQLSNYAFDGSVFDIFGALLNGACLHIAGKVAGMSMQQFAKVLAERQTNIAFMTTALFNLLVEAVPESIRGFDKLFFGGEEASVMHVRKALEYIRTDSSIVHVYGPTESTTFATYYEVGHVDADQTRIPIGRPLANTSVYVLNEQLLPVPAGVPGRIYVGGDGLASGYWQQPELTAARFILADNTFFNHVRLYDTGDMGRQLPGGDIEFMGRNDGQIKIRGHRIETGEIEHALLGYEGLKEVKVTVERTEDGGRHLVAYFTGGNVIYPDVLKQYLSGSLPAYMVPLFFRQLDLLPLNQNGKVDTTQLRSAVVLNAQENEAASFEAPVTELEIAIADIWQAQLNIEAISVRDNFFSLGGDSIKAIRVVSRINEQLQLGVEIKDIFLYQDIHGLAAYISRMPAPYDAAAQQEVLTYLDALRARVLQEAPAAAAAWEEVFPMSDIQKGMIYYSELETDSVVYLVQMYKQVRFPVFDLEILKYTLYLLAHKHPILRTSFDLSSYEVPVQIVWKDIAIAEKLSFEDLSMYDRAHQKKRLEEVLAQDCVQKFRLQEKGLWRIGVYQLGEQEYGLLLLFHHAVMDGWSDASLLAELGETYMALLSDASYQPIPLQATYRDYVTEQLRLKATASMKTYWAQVLDGYQKMSLPLGKRIDDTLFRGQKDQHHFALTPVIIDEVDTLGLRYKLDKKNIYYTAFLLLLAATTNSRDMLVGRVTHNRPEVKDSDKLIGCFLNAIPNRHRLSPQDTLLDIVQQVHRYLSEQKQYEKYSFFEIVGLSGDAAGYNPLFDITFGFLEFHVLDTMSAELEEQAPLVIGSGSTNTFFDFIVEKSGADVWVSMNVAAGVYKKAELRRLETYYTAILQRIAGHINDVFRITDILDETERHELLYNSNNTAIQLAAYPDVLAVISDVAMQYPESTALLTANGGVAYRTLIQQALTMAQLLAEKYDIKKGDRIGVRMRNTATAVPFILGILYCRAVYVPLNSKDPALRAGEIATNAGIAVIITDMEDEIIGTPLLQADLRLLTTSAGMPLAPVEDNDPGDAAYIIHTSGSTGAAKGVIGTHANLLYLGLYQRDYLALRPGAGMLQFANLTFDASILEIFPVLCGGGTLMIPAPEVKEDPASLSLFLENYRPEVAILPPVILPLLQVSALSVLRILMTGGETPAIQDVLPLLPYLKYINGYGVTEGTVISAAYEANEQLAQRQQVPIGRPLGNQQLYILSEELELLPAGVPGELCISGAGVAAGYMHQPELSAARFVPHPFLEGQRLYRTGDWAYRDEEGQLIFAGRRDQQLKISGYRIELGEIENVLHRSPGVRQAAVVPVKSRNGHQQLIACIVPGEGYEKIRVMDFLTGRLPEYMVPAVFVSLEELPLTTNGKVDRKALTALKADSYTSDNFVAPRNEGERQLSAIWSSLLPVAQVGVHDHFFELGGNSLSAMRMVAAIRNAVGIEVSIRSVFRYPTIALLHEHIVSLHDIQVLPEITPQPADTNLPLSFSQERFWFIHQLEGSIQYHIPLILKLSGEVNIPALSFAIREVVNRHAVLRTVIREVAGLPSQHILEKDSWGWTICEAASAIVPQGEQALMQAALYTPFDLTTDHMLKGYLWKAASEGWLLLLVIHHIAADGWSVSILEREITALYDGFVAGYVPALPVLPIQYVDYAIWQRRYLSGKVMDDQLAYWHHQLEGLVLQELPADLPRPVVKSIAGATVRKVVAPALTAQLERWSREQEATLFMTLLGVFNVLLYRYSGQQDICVGTPVAGRTRQETEGLVGAFVNTLALRTRLNREASFVQLLSDIRQMTLAAFDHQDVPFERVVEVLQIPRDISRNPLFEVMFNLQDMPVVSVDIPVTSGTLQSTEIYAPATTTIFDISLDVAVTGDGLLLSLTYCTDLYHQETAARMLVHYERLLEAILADAGQPVGMLPMLTAVEASQLLHQPVVASLFPADSTVIQLIEQQVRQRADAVAVQCGANSYTYAELNKYANRLARRLQRGGTSNSRPVILLMDRAAEVLPGVLGILKAGGIYVPVDPTYPIARLQYILSDTGAACIVTQAHYAAMVKDMGASIITMEEITGAEDAELDTDLGLTVTPDDLCYLIYTSGSTGMPKGVMVEHAGMLNHIASKIAGFGLTADCRIAQTGPLTFDISVWQLLTALVAGGTTVVYPQDLIYTPELLLPQVASDCITVLELVPSYLDAVLEDETISDLTALKYLVVTGEAANPGVLHKWFARYPANPVVNGYGPTEAADRVSHYFMHAFPGWNSIPIGQPIPGMSIYIVDEFGALCPPGVRGEIWIGGPGVARGYWRDRERTAQSFLYDRFGHNRIYRTGDLGRWSAAGQLLYLGRIDHQVKIQGRRIEPAEIESVVIQHPTVHQCLVTVVQTVENTQLVCYIVSTSEFDEGVVMEYLGAHLPEHMIPRIWMVLAAFPLNANGKIDRRSLPVPDIAARLSSGYVAPRDVTEQVLADIWSHLLGLPRVGIDDNFFALGGHSLLGMRLVAAIRQRLQVEISVRDIFLYPTIAGLSGQIETSGGSLLLPAIAPRTSDEALPLSFAQERLWFIDRLQGSIPYHIPQLLPLPADIDVALLAAAIRDVIGRHEVLRTVIVEEAGVGYQQIRAADGWEMGQCVITSIEAYINEPFTLTQDYLLRAAIVEQGDGKRLLLLVVHHIAFDGWSAGILQEELWESYEARRDQRVSSLSPLAIQYADYALWQRKYLSGEILDTRLSYWKQQLTDVPILDLHTDYIRPHEQSIRGHLLHKKVSASTGQALSVLSQQEGTTLFMTLLAVFKVLLYRYTGQDDICVGSPVAGRRQQEVEPLIGFFVNMLALRSRFDGQWQFTRLLREVREVTLDAYTHQDIPFEKIVDAIDITRDISRTPVFQVLFSLQQVSALGEVAITPGSDTAKFDIYLDVTVAAEGILLSLNYCSDLFSLDTMERFLDRYVHLLEAIAADAGQSLDQLPLSAPAALHQLQYDFNNTAATYPDNSDLIDMFLEQVRLYPDRLALVFEDERITYSMLEDRTARLAGYLRTRVPGGSRIGVLMDGSAAMIITILGIIRHGSAYVPLDPAYPAGRLAYMIADSDIHTVITHAGTGVPSGVGEQVQWLLWEEIQAAVAASAPWDGTTNIDTLAYIIYTSGSTGQPKGVMVNHGNIVSLVKGVTYASFTDQVLLATGSPSFDASTFEYWGMLLNGGQLVMCPRAVLTDIPRLREVLVAHSVSMLWCTAGWFNELIETDVHIFDTVTTVMTGAERLSVQHVNRYLSAFPGRSLINGYGPTENTVLSLAYHITSPSAQDIPIGVPLENRTAYILDVHGNLCDIGIAGEICVGGVGLSPGYWNNPSLTAARFVDIPGLGLVYRTGDRGRWQADGNISYLGRIDEQVKLRGYRIELGEIEHVLQGYAGVQQAVVVVSGSGVQRQLVGYVVPEDVNVSTLESWMRDRLPAYMLPSLLLPIAAIPLTANGKIDRRSLSELDVVERETGTYAPPRNATEEILAGIWSELLDLPRVGIHDNFFVLGGHSLLAMRLVSAIRQHLAAEISVRDIFLHSTIAGLSGQVVAASGRLLLPAIQPRTSDEALPLSFAQERLWFIDRLQGSVQYHIPQLVPLPAETDAALLALAIRDVIERHEVLRTVIVEEAGIGYQQIRSAERWALDNCAVTAIDEYIQQPFDLGQDYLLRAAMVEQEDGTQLLLLVVHHIAFDGWSDGILLQELWESYTARQEQRISSLSPLAIQYADYALWQRRYLSGDTLAARLSYWKQQLVDVPVLDLLTDYPRAQEQSVNGALIQQRVGTDVMAALSGISQEHGVTMFMTLLTAFKVLLYRYTGQEDICVGTPIAGRQQKEVEPLIGFFVNTLAL
ncbi:hypothetical protein CK934_00005, partial [Chitinophaga sp. MD30]